MTRRDSPVGVGRVAVHRVPVGMGPAAGNALAALFGVQLVDKLQAQAQAHAQVQGQALDAPAVLPFCARGAYAQETPASGAAAGFCAQPGASNARPV